MEVTDPRDLLEKIDMRHLVELFQYDPRAGSNLGDVVKEGDTDILTESMTIRLLKPSYTASRTEWKIQLAP